jgi:hypothetical protein
MELTLSNLIPHLIYEFKSENDLVLAIDEMSFNFTKNRKNINDYLNDPRLVSAYAAFYLLTNIPKLQAVFHWLPKDWIHLIKKSDFIDLGAGPGTFSFAMKMMGGSGVFYQIETSQLMKNQSRKIWDAFFTGDLFQSNAWNWQTQNSKFLLFGHSANEMGAKIAIQYIEKISPDHILFIEPGTKEFFSEMLIIRDYLLSQNYNILYPCPQQTSCPMTNTQDWCHQFIHIKQDLEIERISQMARKDRKLLPLTVQAYSRNFSYSNPEERLVRVLPETKFSHEWLVCHNNEVEHYQLMKRDLDKKELKSLSNILSGEALLTNIIKIVDRSKRVKLKEIIKF